MTGMLGESRQHPRHKSVEWYTPQWVFDELAVSFDLDPASPHDHESFVPARTKYTVFDDGLAKPWFGRVWLNPPYGRNTPAWMNRMVAHNNGVAMVFSRTDAAWFQTGLRTASALLLIEGRVQFAPGHENKHKRARCGAGTAMFAWGADNAIALARLSSRGYWQPLRGSAFALESLPLWSQAS